MHEFSLAINILEIVEEAVKKNNASQVAEVILDIGRLAGVEIEALETALLSLKPGSMLENADININIITAMAKCIGCQYEFITDSLLNPCPKCGKYGVNIISGNELTVRSITAE